MVKLPPLSSKEITTTQVSCIQVDSKIYTDLQTKIAINTAWINIIASYTKIILSLEVAASIITFESATTGFNSGSFLGP